MFFIISAFTFQMFKYIFADNTFTFTNTGFFEKNEVKFLMANLRRDKAPSESEKTLHKKYIGTELW